MLYQTMGRDFHRSEGRPLLSEARQHTLHVNRRACGVFRRAYFAQKTVPHRAHDGTGFAQQLRPLRHQLSGGGFSVGSCHANQL